MNISIDGVERQAHLASRSEEVAHIVANYMGGEAYAVSIDSVPAIELHLTPSEETVLVLIDSTTDFEIFKKFSDETTKLARWARRLGGSFVLTPSCTETQPR